MKPKRVKCDKCQNFIDVVLEDDNNIISPLVSRAKCKLNHRIMFRIPKFQNKFSYNSIYEGGYFRYCHNFKQQNHEHI